MIIIFKCGKFGGKISDLACIRIGTVTIEYLLYNTVINNKEPEIYVVWV